MAPIFSSKSLATAAANAAGFLQGEYTVSKAEGGWTYEAKETAPTLALAAPVADQGTEPQPVPVPQGDAPEAASAPQEAVQEPLNEAGLLAAYAEWLVRAKAYDEAEAGPETDEAARLDEARIEAADHMAKYAPDALGEDGPQVENPHLPQTMQGMAAVLHFTFALRHLFDAEGGAEMRYEIPAADGVEGYGETDKLLFAFLRAAPAMPLVFPTLDHATAWAKCDGFAKNRLKFEAVEGGFLFRPLAFGEKYVALGSTPRTSNGPAFPAVGTKKRILIDMVCREEGASMEELETAVGWKKCSGTLNELDEAFGLDIEYRKKGKVGRYYGTFPTACAPASEPQQQADAVPLAA